MIPTVEEVRAEVKALLREVYNRNVAVLEADRPQRKQLVRDSEEIEAALLERKGLLLTLMSGDETSAASTRLVLRCHGDVLHCGRSAAL